MKLAPIRLPEIRAAVPPSPASASRWQRPLPSSPRDACLYSAQTDANLEAFVDYSEQELCWAGDQPHSDRFVCSIAGFHQADSSHISFGEVCGRTVVFPPLLSLVGETVGAIRSGQSIIGNKNFVERATGFSGRSACLTDAFHRVQPAIKVQVRAVLPFSFFFFFLHSAVMGAVVSTNKTKISTQS